VGLEIISKSISIKSLIQWYFLTLGKGQPGLLTPCYSGTEPNGAFGPIDPSKDSSYDFIKQLFTEVTKTFDNQYFHLVGDEVDFSCWKSNPNIIDFMKQKHIERNFAKLEEYYVQNVLDIMKALNRSYIVWQEVFNNKVEIKSDTIVHVWKDDWQEQMFNVTGSGFHSLLSLCWYLNYISYGTDWPQYYACDPQNFNETEEQNKLVIGGEACIWGTSH
jgi:hexosaminidase